jgi:hypothetical protein
MDEMPCLLNDAAEPALSQDSGHATVLRSCATHLDTACKGLVTCVCSGYLLLQGSHLVLQPLSNSNIVMLLLADSRHEK